MISDEPQAASRTIDGQTQNCCEEGRRPQGKAEGAGCQIRNVSGVYYTVIVLFFDTFSS